MFNSEIQMKKIIQGNSILIVALLASAPLASAKTAEEVYQQSCKACHQGGLAGAPKVSDKAAWTKRMAERGKDGLYKSAIKGLKAMPPKGLCMSCSDEELKATVDYILNSTES